MRRLRAGLIGSIRAWLPSRRSTAHHCGAVSMTLSGQVRSVRVTFSTSSAKVRYRFTGIEDARWVFHEGWPGLRGPAGVLIARTEEKASDEISGVVMMLAPGLLGDSDRRIANTRDGRPVWIRPRRGVREGAPAARRQLYSGCLQGQNGRPELVQVGVREPA